MNFEQKGDPKTKKVPAFFHKTRLEFALHLHFAVCNQLRASLAGNQTPEQLAGVEKAIRTLQATKATRQVAFAEAADGYLASARAIIRRRADSQRLGPQAAANRNELAAHMATPRGRDDGWIQRATELKKQSDQTHYELALSLRTLGDLLEGLPDAQERVAPFLADESLLLESPVREAEITRARDEALEATNAQAVQLRMILPR